MIENSYITFGCIQFQ